MEIVKYKSTDENINKLKQIAEYASAISDRMLDVVSMLHVMSDSVTTAVEVSQEIALQANTVLFDECV